MRKYGHVWLIAALVAGAAVAAFGFGVRAGEMRDFEVYWTAAHRAAGGEALYRTGDEHYQFKYLPSFAVLARPLAWMPLPAAKSLWFVVSVALIPTLVALSVTLLPTRHRPAWFLAGVAVVVMAKFYGHELVLGQVNLLFGCLVAAALLLLLHGAAVLPAVLLVAAVVVKPYAVIFLPWLLWVRPRSGLALAIACLAVVLVPALAYGVQGTVDLHLAWWKTVTDSTTPNLTNPDNVSLAAFFAKWFGAGPDATRAAAVAGAALVVLCGVVIARGNAIVRRESLEGALLLTSVSLLSPQGWDYVFLIATPAVVLFANYERRLGPWLRGMTWVALATIGLSLFDIMGRARYATFMSWSVITVCFCVLAAALAAIRMRRIA